MESPTLEEPVFLPLKAKKLGCLGRVGHISELRGHFEASTCAVNREQAGEVVVAVI